VNGVVEVADVDGPDGDADERDHLRQLQTNFKNYFFKNIYYFYSFNKSSNKASFQRCSPTKKLRNKTLPASNMTFKI
jgi:hypothetical protein